MLIKSIKIKNLFGMFNYTLNFNYDEKITILYGPNGIGKTVILNLIDNIFQKEFIKVSDVNFHKIVFNLDNNTSLEIERKTDKKFNDDISTLEFAFKKNKRTIKKLLPESYLIEINRERFFLYKRAILKRDYEAKKITKEQYDEEMNELFFVRKYPMPRGRMFHQRISDYDNQRLEFDNLFNKYCVKTELIDTYRLTMQEKSDEERNTIVAKNRVVEYAKDLANKITYALKNYSSVAQEKERTFPIRIIKQTEKTQLDSKVIEKQLIQIESQRSQYEELGLLDKNDDDIRIKISKADNISSTKLSVLSEYIHDNEEKLKTLNELALKITTFKDIINKRFSNKQIYFSNDKGFYFKNRRGEEIDTKNLSSGEQHEIIMFYDFLFNFENDTLIIIDEPELSLHVAWQVEFLKDYMTITENKNNHLLIATHSPQLINDYWNLCIDLESSCEYSA